MSIWGDKDCVERCDLPEPAIVTALETLLGVLVFKSPPSRHSRQFATTETIALAMGGDCGQQIEEIEDDALAGAVLNANGNECLERVSGHV